MSVTHLISALLLLFCFCFLMSNAVYMLKYTGMSWNQLPSELGYGSDICLTLRAMWHSQITHIMYMGNASDFPENIVPEPWSSLAHNTKVKLCWKSQCIEATRYSTGQTILNPFCNKHFFVCIIRLQCCLLGFILICCVCRSIHLVTTSPLSYSKNLELH